MNQATFNATITDTTPGIVAALLTRVSDSPTTSDAPAHLTTTPATTSTNTSSSPSPNCGDPFNSL